MQLIYTTNSTHTKVYEFVEFNYDNYGGSIVRADGKLKSIDLQETRMILFGEGLDKPLYEEVFDQPEFVSSF